MFHQGQAGVTPEALARAHAEYDRRHAVPLREAGVRDLKNHDPPDRARLGFVSPDLGRHPVGYFLVRVPASETYGCNCVLANDRVLLAAGFPGLQTSLVQRGYSTMQVQMSEFQKMDGGLSCLSLRF